MRGFTTIFERFVSFRRVPMRIVVITALTSYVLQVGAIVQGQPLFIIALYTLIPWIPAFLFEGLWKFEHYNWVAVFAIVAALQVGHLGEHAFQVSQLYLLNGVLECPFPRDNAANAQRAIDAGLPRVGILTSSNYSSLNPGYYVVFTGVYDSAGGANSHLQTARDAGFPLAYTRQVTP
jgi:hypothetical protein